MKAILISIKPKWCAKIMNGEKTIEVRTSKALYKATQKLIDEYGYADIYVHCSKGYHNLVKPRDYDKYLIFTNGAVKHSGETSLNGKVIFKFRCYKVEEIVNVDGEELIDLPVYRMLRYKDKWHAEYSSGSDLVEGSCLSREELHKYLANKKTGYAIHISNLEIFDKPKPLWVFEKVGSYSNPAVKCKKKEQGLCNYGKSVFTGKWVGCKMARLTKAPQNFCYVEVE